MEKAKISRADGRRMATFELANLKSAEIFVLEQSIQKRDWKKLLRYLPLIMR
jgi:hypothetical protein